MTLLDGLSDDQVTTVAKIVGEIWWQARGLEALTAYEFVRLNAADAFNAVTNGTVELSNEAEADLYRKCLTTILSSDDKEVSRWVAKAVNDVKRPQAQCDPFVGGALLILATCSGMSLIILSGRVKEVGRIKFSKGVPKEIVTIARIAAKAPVDMAKQLTRKIRDLVN
jgi:hypothetical protein